MKVNLHIPISNTQWWRNFLKSISGQITIPKINDLLIQYNCRYSIIKDNDRSHYYIEFDTEEDYVMFVLRWS